MIKKLLLVLLLVIGSQNAISFAQLNPMYDSIPVESGLKLAMTLYKPAGCTQCPTILIQTPYNRLGFNLAGLPLGVGYNINSSNYNFVVVDWRGFYGSAGASYAGAPTRGEDGYTIVEWIAAQPWSDGQIGTWGPSALGKVQFQTAQYNPPHLVCMVPMVAGPQFNYEEYYPGGVYRTEFVEQLDALGYGLSSVILANPYYNLVWQFSQNINFYPDSIRVPALMVGGWYDHNTEVMIPFFNAIRTNSPVGIRDEHRLLMGPWAHGGSGTAYVGSSVQGDLSYPNAAGWNDSLGLMFFDYHMRNIANGWDATPFVQYYQMGDDAWQSSSTWPPPGITNYNFYLHNDLTMDTYIPSNSTGSLSYNYDPIDPSPTIGGCTLRTDLDQGPYDQDPVVESRNDILVFNTDVLDNDVVLKGRVEAHLKVSSNKKDTDFSIRLTDVYPDGRSELLVDGIKRMRFRNGYTTADTASMVPGTIYDCVIDVPTTAITFKAGHRIRVDITSSNYPKYNRNDNSGGIMYPGANGDSLASPQTAANTVYTNNTHPSYIVLPITGFIDGVEEYAVDWMNIYPNPAENLTNISFTLDTEQELDIIVTDLSGKTIYVQQKKFNAGTNNFILSTNEFTAGLYFVNIHGQGVTSTGKLLVK